MQRSVRPMPQATCCKKEVNRGFSAPVGKWCFAEWGDAPASFTPPPPCGIMPKSLSREGSVSKIKSHLRARNVATGDGVGTARTHRLPSTGAASHFGAGELSASTPCSYRPQYYQAKRRPLGRLRLRCSHPHQSTVPAIPCAPDARPGPFSLSESRAVVRLGLRGHRAEPTANALCDARDLRSEERRVGKECW